MMSPSTNQVSQNSNFPSYQRPIEVVLKYAIHYFIYSNLVTQSYYKRYQFQYSKNLLNSKSHFFAKNHLFSLSSKFQSQQLTSVFV